MDGPKELLVLKKVSDSSILGRVQETERTQNCMARVPHKDVGVSTPEQPCEHLCSDVL